MKVKDFLKEFEGLDPESELVFNMGVGCCGETEQLEFWDGDDYGHGHCVVNFLAPEFLNSCRKYANALGKK